DRLSDGILPPDGPRRLQPRLSLASGRAGGTGLGGRGRCGSSPSALRRPLHRERLGRPEGAHRKSPGLRALPALLLPRLQHRRLRRPRLLLRGLAGARRHSFGASGSRPECRPADLPASRTSPGAHL
ncbi:MAG: Uncharacterized MFS-type transporter YnfM, partial [uncultured Rubrobacteraceae bacterium]